MSSADWRGKLVEPNVSHNHQNDKSSSISLSNFLFYSRKLHCIQGRCHSCASDRVPTPAPATHFNWLQVASRAFTPGPPSAPPADLRQQAILRAGFLSLGIVDILDQMILCFEGVRCITGYLA